MFCFESWVYHHTPTATHTMNPNRLYLAPLTIFSSTNKLSVTSYSTQTCKQNSKYSLFTIATVNYCRDCSLTVKINLQRGQSIQIPNILQQTKDRETKLLGCQLLHLWSPLSNTSCREERPSVRWESVLEPERRGRDSTLRWTGPPELIWLGHEGLHTWGLMSQRTGSLRAEQSRAWLHATLRQEVKEAPE